MSATQHLRRWMVRRRRLFRAWPLILSLLVVWSALAWGAARALIRLAALPRADVIVVLGGSAAYVERTQWAAQLFHQGRAARIVLTNDNQRGGWSREKRRNPFYHERAVEELRRAGVPADKIDVLPQPLSGTFAEALALRQYAATKGVRSFLVVTSPYHTRRAGWTLGRVFREEGGIEIGIDAPPPGRQSPLPLTWWLRPHGWRVVALEYPKLLYYRIRYH
ncbi:MAG: YdcF family protein [Pyrinomonadaceae bacterium]|nr:YdcF family protein [Pyrinomonadaceae bacterium]